MDQSNDQLSISDLYSMSEMRQRKMHIKFDKPRENGIDVNQQVQLANNRIKLLERECPGRKQLLQKKSIRLKRFVVESEHKKLTKSEMIEQLGQFQCKKREINALMRKNIDWKRKSMPESKQSLSLPQINELKQNEESSKVEKKQFIPPEYCQMRLWGTNQLVLNQIMLEKLALRYQQLQKN